MQSPRNQLYRNSKLLLIAAASILAIHLPHKVISAESKTPPNLVLILADDLGYGDVQHLNPQRGKIRTPHIDRLALEGMTFLDAHSGSSVCTPTRYGLLTGRYAWRTRLKSGVLSNYDEPLIAPDRLTLPGMLKQHGYHTACIGKWHLGFTIDRSGEQRKNQMPKDGAPLGSITRNGPTTRGFDLFFGFHHARMMKSVFEGDKVTQRMEPVEMLPKLARRATSYVTERSKTGQPFFLYLPLNSPHTPIVPSQAWQGKSGLGDYADFVMETDWAVGEVLKAIEDSADKRETLIIFTSDNGCSPAAKVAQLEKAGHYPSATYRGYKSDIWEGGHRVPFFVRWPGHVKAASESKQLICLTDIMATWAELLGEKLPDDAGEDSVSFLPVLRGDAQQPVREAVVHHSIDGKFSIRQGEWKLELCSGSGGWGSPSDAKAKQNGEPSVQLYSMSSDAGETTNVQAEYPEVVERLTKLLKSYVSRGRSTPGGIQHNDSPVSIGETAGRNSP